MNKLLIVLAVGSVGCATAGAAKSPSAAVVTIALPGATGPVSLDYLAYEPKHHRVWVPAGDTGSVDVFDAETRKAQRIEGFGVAQVERHGKQRTLGPSSVTVGDRLAWVGDRGDSTVCEVDLETLARGACLKLDARPDAVVWVEPTKELWITAPSEKKLFILDASAPGVLKLQQTVQLEGEPEGYAVDTARGIFFTNYEDLDRTLMIDVKTREIRATWQPRCGEDGPKGLAFDPAFDQLLVACTDAVVVLDVAHGGAELSRLKTGAGNDNLDYAPRTHRVYAGSAKDATLTVAVLDAAGKLTASQVIPTVAGSRNAVVTEAGVAWLADGPQGQVVVVTPDGR